MKNNSDLFALIKSLDKAEKRQFNLFSRIQRGEKHYLRLFAELNSQVYYDEQKTKQKLGKDPLIKHWAVNKKYLYDRVLETLHYMRHRKDPDSEVGYLLECYKILREKGHPRQAIRFLRKAKRVATAADLFTRLYNIINQEYFDILLSSQHAADLKRIDRIIAERQEVLKRIENYSFVGDIFSRQRMWIRINGSVKTEQDRKSLYSLAAPLMSIGREHLLSDTARNLFNMAMADYHQALGEPEKALPFIHRHISDLRNSKLVKSEVLIGELSTYLSLALRNRIFKGYDEMLAIFKAQDYRPPEPFQYFIYERWFSFVVLGYCARGEFGQAVSFLKKELLTFERHAANMSQWARLLNTYAVAYAFFGDGQYKKASAWIANILRSDETDLETYSYAKILQLFILIESQTDDSLDDQIRSLERHLKSRKRTFAIEIGLPAFLRQATSGSLTKKDFATVLRKLKDESVAMRDFSFYFDLRSWLESKRKNIPFGQAIKTHLKR
jgi:tetratricopeptide (TPR) repeat protein